jgi:hybrid cluster-associated redox disulfide protein
MRQPLADLDLCLDALMKHWPMTIPVFLNHKMLCVGCMVSPFHTVFDACEEYGLDEDSFRDELLNAINAAARP